MADKPKVTVTVLTPNESPGLPRVSWFSVEVTLDIRAILDLEDADVYEQQLLTLLQTEMDIGGYVPIHLIKKSMPDPGNMRVKFGLYILGVEKLGE